jgi:endonuclease I
VSYSELWQSFYTTDVRPDNGKVWDIYSDQPGGTPAYYFTFGTDQCGNFSSEGDCYNREHSVPKSWFGGYTPMYTDLFHLYPTDGYVNNKRGNLPIGKVTNTTWTSTNGSKVGTSNISGYSGQVFEPIDSFKGDFARTYFYMATCYKDKNLGMETQSNFTGGDLKPWAKTLLLQWAAMDPVSQKEISRNNAVYQIQNNRNPFIDYPELAEKVFGNDATPFNTSVSDFANPNRWKIYPNPTTSIINIQSFDYQIDKLTIEIQDVTGKTLLTHHYDHADNIQIDLSKFPRGLYFIKLSSEQYTHIYKIVKQ